MGERPRRRAQSWIFVVVFVTIVVGSVAGFLVARERASRAAERRADQAAARAAAALETEVTRTVAGLAGSSAVVDGDGRADPDVFAAFAADLAVGNEVRALVLVEPADDGYVVAAAHPGRASDAEALLAPDAAGRALDGAGRALDAAGRTGEPALGGRVELGSQAGIAVVRPLWDRLGDGEVVAFVVTVLPLEALDRIADVAAGDDLDIAILDGETLRFGEAFDPRLPVSRAAATVPGGRWTVVAGPVPGPDLTPAWLVAGAGAVAIVAMAALVITTERHQRRLAGANALLRMAEERTRAAQEVSGRLARALSGTEVATALVEHLPAAVGGCSAAIAIVDEGGRLQILGTDEAGVGDETRRELPYDEGSHVEAALTRGQPAWLQSPLPWREDAATATLAAGGQALALLPLASDDVTGVLAVAYPKVHIFDDDEKALLQTVGLLASRALARGHLYDAEHRAAVAFQRTALPDELPAVDGLTIVARYRPATHRAAVGGDWYDVLVLDDRRVALVVGDVVGHGIVAAATMGRLRTAFQAIASLSTDPGSMLRAMNHQVGSIPNSFCTTVVCAVVDLATRTLTWSRAGHPPPLVLSGEEAVMLDERCMPPLGVDDGADPPVHSRHLDVGDRLLLFTDGVVERRTESIEQGFHRLRVAAETLADLEPTEFTDALVEAIIPSEEQSDDLALLVVRVDEAAGDVTPARTGDRRLVAG